MEVFNEELRLYRFMINGMLFRIYMPTYVFWDIYRYDYHSTWNLLFQRFIAWDPPSQIFLSLYVINLAKIWRIRRPFWTFRHSKIFPEIFTFNEFVLTHFPKFSENGLSTTDCFSVFPVQGLSQAMEKRRFDL